MKKLSVLFIVFINCSVFSQNLPSIHSFTTETIDHEIISLGQYTNKKILLVNTASFCMYTPQYTALQQLYDSYKQYNFEILGFPCNDFGAQDPYSDSTIHVFCTSNYSVTFQMMSKVSIIAGDTSPIYKWLQRANLNGKQNVSVDWNFNKFLIDECGHWVKHYVSQVSPLDTAITNWILSAACETNLVGLKEEKKAIQMISTNPVASSLDFKINDHSAEAYTLDIITVSGTHIGDIVQEASREAVIHYDVSSLANGVYFLQVKHGSTETNLKFVVMK
jgi:glutathione peroxidase